MTNKQALKEIFYSLNQGKKYGKNITSVRFPYFDTALQVDYLMRYIHWNHFGSSANRNTQTELDWIIRNIFHTTPLKFIKEYECI